MLDFQIISHRKVVDKTSEKQTRVLRHFAMAEIRKTFVEVWLVCFLSKVRRNNVDINPFHTTCLVLYPLIKSESHSFSDVFRRYRKRPVV